MHKPIAIRLNAGHDRNGNPRRIWLILKETDSSEGECVATVMDAIDEGYIGKDSVRQAGYTEVCWGPEIEITPGEYRGLLKAAKGR